MLLKINHDLAQQGNTQSSSYQRHWPERELQRASLFEISALVLLDDRSSTSFLESLHISGAVSTGIEVPLGITSRGDLSSWIRAYGYVQQGRFY